MVPPVSSGITEIVLNGKGNRKHLRDVLTVVDGLLANSIYD
jgi:hypothetical protein